ncbi:uncharacterized protein STEHIDRAFT_115245 [Stereum hirsutum FP-91666 SS1]|uniref:uncharacterized protein n=1 Tax=Stereum hirsutum (strain FP-91666) TaxID=721885 RepID=UPI0004449C41|nr:uncharacterized protein STEHIDRAFT_115245 [Stereum hirsutum FP-91666 SS1]EIM81078.1 hypothetical protein STEHIDRAFT_115245 [Stereum hirsutum FP-91666 SS1]
MHDDDWNADNAGGGKRCRVLATVERHTSRSYGEALQVAGSTSDKVRVHPFIHRPLRLTGNCSKLTRTKENPKGESSGGICSEVWYLTPVVKFKSENRGWRNPDVYRQS